MSKDKPHVTCQVFLAPGVNISEVAVAAAILLGAPKKRDRKHGVQAPGSNLEFTPSESARITWGEYTISASWDAPEPGMKKYWVLQLTEHGAWRDFAHQIAKCFGGIVHVEHAVWPQTVRDFCYPPPGPTGKDPGCSIEKDPKAWKERQDRIFTMVKHIHDLDARLLPGTTSANKDRTVNPSQTSTQSDTITGLTHANLKTFTALSRRLFHELQKDPQYPAKFHQPYLSAAIASALRFNTTDLKATVTVDGRRMKNPYGYIAQANTKADPVWVKVGSEKLVALLLASNLECDDLPFPTGFLTSADHQQNTKPPVVNPVNAKAHKSPVTAIKKQAAVTSGKAATVTPPRPAAAIQAAYIVEDRPANTMPVAASPAPRYNLDKILAKVKASEDFARVLLTGCSTLDGFPEAVRAALEADLF